jgi:RNA polymerase sigma-70 factor, ECF subfamily
VSSSAFTTTYTTHAQALERYIARIVRDRQAARDLTHDTLVKALVHGEHAAGWLYRVARNAALDHLRTARRTVLEDPRALDERRELSGRPSLDWGASDRVHEALDELPGAQREVTLLRYHSGLSTAEIGSALGKTPAAVRQLEARALRTLRTRLAESA